MKWIAFKKGSIVEPYFVIIVMTYSKFQRVFHLDFAINYRLMHSLARDKLLFPLVLLGAVHFPD